MPHQERQQGFTLIELLVALAVMAIVVVQAFSIFSTQHRAHTGLERSIEVQEASRLVADAILSDLRMAGFMIPQRAGVASVDGGTNAADIICISDPTKIAASVTQDAVARLNVAGTTALVGAGVGGVTIAPADVDIDGDGDNDFVAGEGIILVDGTSSHCGFITGVSGTNSNIIAFTPDTPAGFSAPAASARAVPAVVYRLNGSELLRNSLRLAHQIEDIQIEFGIDSDADGLLADNEYEDDLNGDDPLDLLALRLSVISRSERDNESIWSKGRPAAANRIAGAADNVRRRSITATIMPRNLISPGG